MLSRTWTGTGRLASRTESVLVAARAMGLAGRGSGARWPGQHWPVSQGQQVQADSRARRSVGRASPAADHGETPNAAWVQMTKPLSRMARVARTMAPTFGIGRRRPAIEGVYLAFFSAASILAMYLAVSFLKSFRQDLQQSFTSRPSWVNT